MGVVVVVDEWVVGCGGWVVFGCDVVEVDVWIGFWSDCVVGVEDVVVGEVMV